ncbi:MAG: hypothetical protein ACE5NM_02140, partial [Sedimentisphaerales bacterium]
MRNSKCLRRWQECCLVMSLSVGLALLLGQVCMAAQSEAVHHYKLLSSLQYSGKSQFSNELETVCTVKKLALSDDKVQYCLST